jgi:hypothetical protein
MAGKNDFQAISGLPRRISSVFTAGAVFSSRVWIFGNMQAKSRPP